MASHLHFLKSIVRCDFGKSVEAVAESLIVRGPQDLAQVKRNTGLGKAAVQKGLIVLVAHSIVRVRSQEKEAPPAKSNENSGAKPGEKRKAESNKSPAVSFTYEVDVEAIRHRISAPWYVQTATQRFGKEGGLILETFCQHGKLLLSQVVELCVARLLADEGEAPEEAVVEETKASVNDVFEEMRRLRYIKPARVIGQAAPPPEKKQKTNDWGGEEEEEYDDGGQNLSGDPSTTYWCINNATLLRDVRNNEIVGYVRHKHREHSRIIELLFKAHPAAAADATPAVTGARFVQLAKDHPECKLPETKIKDALETLSSEKHKVLLKLSDGYVLNREQITQQLQLDQAQSIVVGKFDQLAGRIFRLLMTYKRLEEKQIVELATAPKQKVRAALYSMHSHGFASMQELSRTSDRHPSRMIFLWGVPLSKVFEDLLTRFCTTWCNIKCRLVAEAQRMQPLHDKVDLQEPLLEAEKESMRKWRKANNRMHLSLLQMDKLIRLFRDFD